MNSRHISSITAFLRLGIALLSIIVATILWMDGFFNSPAGDSTRGQERRFLTGYLQQNRVDLQLEQEMAEAYWLRYPDVRANDYWGPAGPLGIWGARDHYRQHGKREQRVFGNLAKPADLRTEEELARAYWQRYPDVRQHLVWGESGRLGIYGARDHYRYLGRLQGKWWGISR